MTTEELLRPRWKVIADFPGNDKFEVGDIITDYVFAQEPYCYFIKVMIEGSTFGIDPDEYPHLFKKLEWWEDREKEDMPEYLKFKKDGEIVKAELWSLDPNFVLSTKYPNNMFIMQEFFPSTEEEYLNQE